MGGDAGYDVIVAPERTTALLRRFGVKSRLVYTQHGAGDRAGPFEPLLAAFEFLPAQREAFKQTFDLEGSPGGRAAAAIARLLPPAQELEPERRKAATG